MTIIFDSGPGPPLPRHVEIVPVVDFHMIKPIAAHVVDAGDETIRIDLHLHVARLMTPEGVRVIIVRPCEAHSIESCLRTTCFCLILCHTLSGEDNLRACTCRRPALCCTVRATGRQGCGNVWVRASPRFTLVVRNQCWIFWEHEINTRLSDVLIIRRNRRDVEQDDSRLLNEALVSIAGNVRVKDDIALEGALSSRRVLVAESSEKA
mmetsp:Transcript_11827/g.24193  ORF Transcript_11827/g.24193 Transcript_11827/m.24193 type:complete len:208 (-) Transcript_11827:3065-3688(-)